MIFQIFYLNQKENLLKKSDRVGEWYNSIFQNFLKSKNIHLYSRFSTEGPSIAERVIRTITKLIKKAVFGKGNASWLPEPSSVIKQYNNTIHHSIKMTPNRASEKTNETLVNNNLKDDREKQQPKVELGQLVRTADFERVFS